MKEKEGRNKGICTTLSPCKVLYKGEPKPENNKIITEHTKEMKNQFSSWTLLPKGVTQTITQK